MAFLRLCDGPDRADGADQTRDASQRRPTLHRVFTFKRRAGSVSKGRLRAEPRRGSTARSRAVAGNGAFPVQCDIARGRGKKTAATGTKSTASCFADTPELPRLAAVLAEGRPEALLIEELPGCYSYSEWAKGRFSEAVTVTGPGKM